MMTGLFRLATVLGVIALYAVTYWVQITYLFIPYGSNNVSAYFVCALETFLVTGAILLGLTLAAEVAVWVAEGFYK